MNRTPLFATIIFLTISACGGGGGSESPTPEPPIQYKVSINGPVGDSALAGESIGLVLAAPESNISQIVWQQTAGPAISFLGSNRKVIGFDVPATGSYSFSVNFRDSAGGARSANYTFTATSDSNVYLNARLDHEANSEAKMTLYAYENFPGTLASVSWTQISGPTATLTDTNQLAIFFTAPSVTIDTLLQFQVDATDDQGNSASDIVNILLEPETINPNSLFAGISTQNVSLADVYPYNPNAEYSDEIQECIYSNTTDYYCNLGKIPFIGSQNPTPTVDNIMDRVLVSHDWMGIRFKNFLEQVDTSNDIKNLMGATRSIVISYDIKPSFFWAGTGAIYIDAKYFWVTPQERDTVDATPDFRSNFDKDLQFRDPWRVIKDNNYAYSTPLIESRSIRTVEQSQYYVLRVFYHELAHANDFFPPRAWSSAANSDLPWTYSSNNQPDSDNLASTYTLNSQEMYALGDVMFQGNTATPTQQNYTPAQVSDFFFPFSGTNSYNYSTKREDYAMLAEEYLMGYRYGIQYDQGITGLAPDYIISTAERGRVALDRIRPRAEFVISRILPSIDVQAASATLAAPITLDSGISWWDALVPSSQAKAGEQKKVDRLKHPMTFGADVHPAKRLKVNINGGSEK